MGCQVSLVSGVSLSAFKAWNPPPHLPSVQQFSLLGASSESHSCFSSLIILHITLISWQLCLCFGRYKDECNVRYSRDDPQVSGLGVCFFTKMRSTDNGADLSGSVELEICLRYYRWRRLGGIWLQRSGAQIT